MLFYILFNIINFSVFKKSYKKQQNKNNYKRQKYKNIAIYNHAQKPIKSKIGKDINAIIKPGIFIILKKKAAFRPRPPLTNK